MLSDSFNHESSIDKESLPYGTNRNDGQIQEKEEEKKGENYMSDEEENIDDGSSDSENQNRIKASDKQSLEQESERARPPGSSRRSSTSNV